MLRGSKLIFFRLPDVVFELPGLAISIGHADHDGGSPGQGKKSAKCDEKSQGLIAIRQDIRNKSQGRIATSRKKDWVNPSVDEIEVIHKCCPKQDLGNMDEGNEDKCHVEVEEDPTVLFIREIDGSHTFKAHQ